MLFVRKQGARFFILKYLILHGFSFSNIKYCTVFHSQVSDIIRSDEGLTLETSAF